jgi:hypothetical protein
MADWSANGTDNAHPTGWQPAQDGAPEHPLVYVLPDGAYYGARVQHALVYAPAAGVPSAVPFPSQALPLVHPMHYPPSAADRPLRRRSVTAPSSYFPHHASSLSSFEPMPPAFGQAPPVFAAPTLYQDYAPVEPTTATPSAPLLVSRTSRAAPVPSKRRSRTRSSRRRRTPEASSSSATPRDPADPAPSTVRRTRKKLRQDASHVNRPMNMFILFRNDWVRRHRADGYAAGTAAHHSAEASVAWRALGPDERAVWAAKADEEKVKHAAAHPDYVYRPRRREQSTETPASEVGHDEPAAAYDDTQVSPSALPFVFGEYSPTGPPLPPLHAPAAGVLPLRALPMQLSHSLPLPPRPSSTDLAMPSPTRTTREFNRRSLSAHGLRAFGEHARVWLSAEESMSVHNMFAQTEQNVSNLLNFPYRTCDLTMTRSALRVPCPVGALRTGHDRCIRSRTRHVRDDKPVSSRATHVGDHASPRVVRVRSVASAIRSLRDEHFHRGLVYVYCVRRVERGGVARPRFPRPAFRADGDTG